MDGFILSISKKPLIKPLYPVLDVEKPPIYHIHLPESLVYQYH